MHSTSENNSFQGGSLRIYTLCGLLSPFHFMWLSHCRYVFQCHLNPFHLTEARQLDTRQRNSLSELEVTLKKPLLAWHKDKCSSSVPRVWLNRRGSRSQSGVFPGNKQKARSSITPFFLLHDKGYINVLYYFYYCLCVLWRLGLSFRFTSHLLQVGIPQIHYSPWRELQCTYPG